jgi:hypothetical protein
MEFERVLNGILRYLNKEIYSNMEEWQEVVARIAVSRMIGNSEVLKQSLMDNTFIKTFAIMDDNGLVDVEGLIRDLRQQIQQKGKLTINFPLLGKFTFNVDDVDKLHNAIMEV